MHACVYICVISISNKRNYRTYKWKESFASLTTLFTSVEGPMDFITKSQIFHLWGENNPLATWGHKVINPHCKCMSISCIFSFLEAGD